MVKRLAFLLLIGLIWNLAALPAQAQKPLPTPNPGDLFPLPTLVPSRPVRPNVVLRLHRVDVTIQDQVATTHLQQVLRNEGSGQAEGQYYLPLPENAAISDFSLTVDGQKYEGKILSKAEARAIYESIVRSQRDPALLEYAGHDLFQANVFPIPASAERTVDLTFRQVLPKTEGLVRYRYPFNTRYLSLGAVGTAAITVKLQTGQPLKAIYSPTHSVKVTREADSRATVSFEANNYQPDRDFELVYSTSADPLGVSLLSSKPAGEDGYFLLLITPAVQVERKDIVARDVVVVLDTSGSMQGAKIDQGRRALTYVLDHLGPDDRFNLITFSSSVRAYAPSLLPAAQAGDAKRFVSTIVAEGSTDINRALLEALALFDPARPGVVIFITDGLPTVGVTEPPRILENVSQSAPKNVRIFTFGLGYDVNTTLLDGIANAQRGVSGYVKPNEQVDEAVGGLYTQISTPVLTDISLTWQGDQVYDVYPHPLPDLFAGNQLLVVGRYRTGGPVDLTLSGQVNGRSQSQTFKGLTLNRTLADDYVSRLWATRKVGYLLNQLRLNKPNQETIDEVVRLSQRFGIITPYTSFLAQEPNLPQPPRSGGPLPPQPAPLGAGSGGGASAQKVAEPTKAPAAAVAGAIARDQAAPSGASAVNNADAVAKLNQSQEAYGTNSQSLKQVGDKTFKFQDGFWVDTSISGTPGNVIEISFGSQGYFDLLTQHPEWGRYLAVGEQTLVALGDKVYRIVATSGETAANPVSTPLATPSPGITVTPMPQPNFWEALRAWLQDLVRLSKQ